MQKLTDFLVLQRKFMQTSKPNDLARELFKIEEKFENDHPEIRLNERSNIIDTRTFAAHGTNAWAVFLACALTDGQLLPRNATKVRGVPIVSGELGNEKRTRDFPNTISQNGVSAIRLNVQGTDLKEVFCYAEKSTDSHRYNYQEFVCKYLEKYRKESTQNVVEKAITLFDDVMEDAYQKLSEIPVVVLGNRIGGSAVNAQWIQDECLCKRFNILVIILPEKNSKYIQDLLGRINPQLSISITYLTREDFEKSSSYQKFIVQDQNKESQDIFIDHFTKEFGNQLTFNFSDQFDTYCIEEKQMVRSIRIKITAHTVTYYIDKQQSSSTLIKNNIEYKSAFTQPLTKQDKMKESTVIEWDRLTTNQQIMFKTIKFTIDITSDTKTLMELYKSSSMYISVDQITKLGGEYRDVFHARDENGKMLIDYANQIKYKPWGYADLEIWKSRYEIINAIMSNANKMTTSLPKRNDKEDQTTTSRPSLPQLQLHANTHEKKIASIAVSVITCMAISAIALYFLHTICSNTKLTLESADAVIDAVAELYGSRV